LRTLNQPGAATQVEGTEPIIIIRIEWGQGSGFHFYNDKTAPLTRGDGRIISFSPISATQQGNQSSNVSQASVVVDDFDGKLKGVVDVSEMEGSPATVFHQFLNTPGSSTEVLSGRVSGPVVWDEGERTVSFDIVTEIESDLIGFSADSEQFDANNDVAVGKPWPLVFGKPAHVPAVLVQTIPESITLRPISFGANFFNEDMFTEVEENKKTVTLKQDSALQQIIKTPFNSQDLVISEINKIDVEEPEKFPQDVDVQVEIGGVIFNGKFSGGKFNVTEANGARYVDILLDGTTQDEPDAFNPKVAWLKRNDVDLVNNWCQVEYTHTEASGFQRKEIVENLCIRQEGTKCWFKRPWLAKEFPGATILEDEDGETDYALPGVGAKFSAVIAVPSNGLVIDVQEFLVNYQTKLKQFDTAQKTADADKSQLGPLIRQLELIKFIKSAFWNVSEGATIKLWYENITAEELGTTGDIYVANFFESASVDAVYAVRTVKEHDRVQKEVFVPIPKQYYEVDLSRDTNVPELAGQLVTTLEFSRGLDSYVGQGWKKNAIYVTLTSTVSSNTSTQLEFILGNYTDLVPNAGSFATAAGQVTKYPSHFYILGEPNALALAKDIAFQARLGLILDSEEVRIKYLSEKPVSSVLTLDEDTTRFKTMSLGFTPIDNVITRIKGTWRRSGAPDIDKKTEDRTLTFSNNTNKFGVKEQDINFFIYNDESLVRKSMNFWLNRFSYSWRLIDLETFTDAMGLQVFDDVLIFHSVFLLPFSSQISEIRGFSHDVHNAAVNLNIWVPVVSGETDVAPFAYLEDAADSTPTNFADSFEEVEYVINRSMPLNLEGMIRELKRQRTVSKRLGKLTPGKKSINFSNKYKADMFGEGSCAVATEEDVTVYTPNPQLGLQEGDWVQVSETEDGINIAEPVISASREMRVVTIKGDYLECAFHEGPMPLTLVDDDDNPQASTATVNVAKPQEMRVTDFDGQSIPNVNDDFIDYSDFTADGQERVATRSLPAPEVVETQVIVPRYLPERTVTGNIYPGSLIIAKYQPAGSGVTDADGKILYWEDSNHAGREWAKKFE
jgi:hypothetical protein